MYLRKIDFTGKKKFLVYVKSNAHFFCQFSIAVYIAI